MAAVIMGSLSGSAVADTAALAALLLPMMNKAGYDKARSGGLIASAAIIAPDHSALIGFVIFGVTANVSISKLFLAGIVPGMLLGVAWPSPGGCCRARQGRGAAARQPQGNVAALKDATFALGLPAIVIAGLKFGVFTPTEAAVVAAIYALFVSTVIYRELHLGRLGRCSSTPRRPRRW
jgi:TRAP-type transport system large permease protein